MKLECIYIVGSSEVWISSVGKFYGLTASLLRFIVAEIPDTTFNIYNRVTFDYGSDECVKISLCDSILDKDNIFTYYCTLTGARITICKQGLKELFGYLPSNLYFEPCKR